MGDKSHSTGFGQQGGHGDSLWFELFVKCVQGIGSDGHAYSEFWDFEGLQHIARDCLLEGGEGDGGASEVGD